MWKDMIGSLHCLSVFSVIDIIRAAHNNKNEPPLYTECTG